jgi:NADH-quinone oxidoreductase subunit A
MEFDKIHVNIPLPDLFLSPRHTLMFQLLQADLKNVVNDVSTSGSYIPVAIQILLVVGLIGTLLAVTHWLGPKRKTADKLENFASGIESHGEARQPMAIKYFLVAILFVLFEGLGWAGFWSVMMFVGFFLCGFIYIIKKGALKWED